MLNFYRRAELAPVLLDRADTMRAYRNDLFDTRLLQRCEIRFRKLPEREIITEPTNRVARAALFFQNSERGVQVLHHRCEGADNLTAPRIVRTHATEPQAVLLRSIEN